MWRQGAACSGGPAAMTWGIFLGGGPVMFGGDGPAMTGVNGLAIVGDVAMIDSNGPI